MGLQDTLRDARIGQEAQRAQVADKNRTAGREEGAIAENQKIEREAKIQDRLLAKQAEDEARAMLIHKQGQRQGRAEAMGYPSDEIQMQADAMANANIGPEMGNGMVPEQTSPAQDIVAQIDQAQANGQDVRKMVASIPDELRGEIDQIQQERALEKAGAEGQVLAPTAMPEPVQQSPANMAKDAILSSMAQDAQEKQQAEQEAIQMEQMQQAQQMKEQQQMQ